ncbi:MAG: ATP-binding protein [Candidatus Sericytochromatia bacterium]|nr:ATP-binding protein [Candidatus Sericytochromatia bacterium]
MTDDHLRALLVAGETLKVEFKSDRDPLSDADLYRNVVGLANAEGGVLLLGVENDGRVTGLHPSRARQVNPVLLQAAIFNNTMPPINTRVAAHELPEGMVVSFEVDPYPSVCATKDGVCVRRVVGERGPSCVPFYPMEHLGRRIQLGIEDLSAHALDGAGWHDLSPREFERLRTFIANAPGDRRLLSLNDEDLAKALKLVETSEDGSLVPVLAGLLLLGEEAALQRYVPTHKTMFQVLSDVRTVAVNERLPSPLLRQVEDLEARFDARREEKEVMVGFQRVPVPLYDRDAYREAVVNALLHRDYSTLGAVYVQWHGDHLLITSPGGFPRGITRDNLLTHEPVPRNPRLAEVCARIGLAETSARGVDRIYEGQLRFGRPLPDYEGSDDTAVRLRLQSAGANLEFVKFIRTYEAQAGRQPLEHLMALLMVHQAKRLDAEAFRSAIQRNDQAARAVLESLVARGVLEAQGERQRTYNLSAEAYRTYGQASEYVRVRGLDPIRQAAMIEAYVAAHGRITRTEAADLCLMDPEEAGRLLARLTDERRLTRLGAKRGAHYVLRQPEPLRPLAGVELRQAIIKLLQETSPLTLQQIDEALAARGFEVAGNNKRNYLTATMSRDKATFRGLGRGLYQLVEGAEG